MSQVNINMLVLNFIWVAAEKLMELKKLLTDLKANSENVRIDKSILDIENSIKEGFVVMSNEDLYNFKNFRYDSLLMKLIDSIQFNDFGVKFSDEKENARRVIINEIMKNINDINTIIYEAMNKK